MKNLHVITLCVMSVLLVACNTNPTIPAAPENGAVETDKIAVKECKEVLGETAKAVFTRRSIGTRTGHIRNYVCVSSDFPNPAENRLSLDKIISIPMITKVIVD